MCRDVASWPWTAKAREDMRVDATVRHDAGGYTDDGWTETTHITAAGSRGADGWSAGAATEEPAAAAEELVPWHPTLGDVDSSQALADYQATKRAHKAEWLKARSA